MVELKGRVACEISSADELVLTELIFGGTLKECTVEQLVSLLSCFVWREKTKAFSKLPEELAGPFSQLREVARRVGKIEIECKVISTKHLVQMIRSGSLFLGCTHGLLESYS